jgi:hypothetical protein
MMPTPDPETAAHTAALKHAVTMVFVAVNSCDEPVTATKVGALIEAQCGQDAKLRKMAFDVLAAVMVGVARSKAAGIERGQREAA